MAHAGWRPLLFKTKEDLKEKIDAYFASCYRFNEDTNREECIRPLTISGLAVELETSRQTLINYWDSEEFFDTIKKAKQRIENWTEEQLYRNTQVTGVIFNLKNNYDWKDKSEVDSNTKVTVVWDVLNSIWATRPNLTQNDIV